MRLTLKHYDRQVPILHQLQTPSLDVYFIVHSQALLADPGAACGT